MSRINETRHISWHEICICNCGLDASVCNNKQRWNNDNGIQAYGNVNVINHVRWKNI